MVRALEAQAAALVVEDWAGVAAQWERVEHALAGADWSDPGLAELAPQLREAQLKAALALVNLEAAGAAPTNGKGKHRG